MADQSKIEWTEATWNPITGCTVKSAGCRDCYAMTLAGTRLKNHPSRAGLTRQNADGKHIWTGEVRFNEAWLDQPLKWKKPRMIFVCAHGDLFHEAVPDEWIDRVFAVMALCPQHVFQVLTKRPDRMREYCLARNGMGNSQICREINEIPYGMGVRHSALKMPLPNVWFGTSVEDQESADERIPDLLSTPAAVRWLSMEPLLGAVEIDLSQIDWVVLGGESGSTARPMHTDWARQIRDQCEAANVPFFFKQWGEYVPHPSGEEVTIRQFHNSIRYVGIDTGECKPHPDRHTDETMRRIGKKKAGRELDGRTHDAMPMVQS
jgi:protein gp37